MSQSLLWPDMYTEFLNIKYPDNTFYICWDKKHSINYHLMAECYYLCSCNTIEEILKDINNNRKSDMWFLPCIYMMRQSIELEMKALLCDQYLDKASVLQEMFLKHKHDLVGLYSELFIYGKCNLSFEETDWLSQYLSNIEQIDRYSDMFRFPYDDVFLSKYRNTFVDIAETGNNLDQCLGLLRKSKDSDYRYDFEPFPPLYLVPASQGFGNCYLWQPLYDNGFYPKISGYLDVADFLLNNSSVTVYTKAYPLLFLLRNSIELCLKRIFYSQVRKGVPINVFNSKKRSHNIKELWKCVKPVIGYYAQEQGYDLSIIDRVEANILQLHSIDKNGDRFRYPASYNFEYKIDISKIDIKYSHEYIKALCNFLDGCDSMLDYIANYESEMENYYCY